MPFSFSSINGRFVGQWLRLTLGLLAAASASAATLTWNQASGNWDTTTSNWTGTTWVNGSDAVFGGTAGSTITLNTTGLTAKLLRSHIPKRTDNFAGLRDTFEICLFRQTEVGHFGNAFRCH